MSHSEIGRELKVSDLKPKTIVVLRKGAGPMATIWVWAIGPDFVQFWAGDAGMGFLAMRCGPDLEQITDDSNTPMKIFEYLGEP